MHKNKIFIKTAKAEKKGAKLDTDLKRLLSYLDGKTSSGDLSRRVPPSLRKNWDDLIAELLKGGYIVDIPAPVEASPERKVSSTELNPMWMGQVKARVNSERTPQIAPSVLIVQTAHSVANSQTTQTTKNTAAQPEFVNETNSVTANKDDRSEAHQKAEKAARTAELKAYFAAAKEKAKAEAKQAALEAERARAELEAAAAEAKLSVEAENKAKLEAQKRVEEAERARIELETAVAAAKTRSDALAKAKEEARQRDEEAARARAELEAAVAASKNKSDARTKLKVEVKQEVLPGPPAEKSAHLSKRHRFYKLRGKFCVMDANELARLRNLQSENEALKNLLTEAYIEITSLKSSLQNKP